MKVIILAGGWGSRLGQLTESVPKPMVSIGNKPVLWHIMKIYSHYGFNEFVIALGVKGQLIKDYNNKDNTRAIIVKEIGFLDERLNLARALLGNPKILILDEATSNLDVLTEEKIVNTVLKLVN
jgi:NDP-sugar pyrophosphorylase family protein